MTDKGTSGQSVQKSPELSEGLFLMDGIKGLRSLPRHSVDMLLTDPPYGTTRNFWDVPLPLPELWEAVKWAVKPEGAVLFFAQCPYDKVLGASNLSMLRYEWIWYKERGTGFLNANRAPLKKVGRIFWCSIRKPRFTIRSLLTASRTAAPCPQRHQPELWKIRAAELRVQRWAALSGKCAVCSHRNGRHPSHAKARGAVRVFYQDLYPARRTGGGHLRGLRHNGGNRPQHGPPLPLF